MTAVAVVGAINVDLRVAAPHLPGPGETVLGGRLRRSGGGKGANAAIAAARAGAEVRLIGAVGADPDGIAQRDELVAAGVDVEDVAVLSDAGTGVALIITDPAGENQIAVAAGANARLSAGRVRAALDRRRPELVLVSAEVDLPAISAAVRWSAAAGVRCLVNPAPVRPELVELVSLASVLTPNRGELVELMSLLTRTTTAGSVRPLVVPPAVAQALGPELAARSGAAVVVTLGEAGALIAYPDGGTRSIAAPVVHAIDSIGAGDVFNGVLAAGLAAGVGLVAATEAAVAAATRSVTGPGARW